MSVYQIQTDRLIITPLTRQEMEQIQSGTQNFLEKSVLSDIIMLAIADKTDKMHYLPEEMHPWITYWLIAEQKSALGIGLIGSKFLPDEEGYVELGYAIAEPHQGQGYMTEALNGFLDWLYDWPFLNGALLRIQKNNHPSVRTAANCGFQSEGTEDGYQIFRYSFETVVSDG